MEKIGFIYLKITPQCNFECTYCYNKISHKKKEVFDQFEEAFNFIKSLPLENVIQLVLTGGEATTSTSAISKAHSLAKQIEKECKIKVCLALITNGSNGTLLKDILNQGIMEDSSIQISWDGFHNVERVYPKTITDEYYKELFNQLSKDGYKPIVNLAISNKNISRLRENLHYLNNLGFVYSYYFLREYEYDEESFNIFQQQLSMFLAETKSLDNLINYNIYKNLDEKDAHHCVRLKKSLSISSDGRVYPCLYLIENDLYCLGTLSTGIDYNIYEDFINIYPCISTKCSECENARCVICPSVNLIETGNASITPNYICRFFTIEKELIEAKLNNL